MAYDGTDFSGWQIQPGQRTVQLELEQALTSLTGQTTRVNCSGRTDAGVHARGQVVHFDLATRIPLARFKLALNSKLPPDVRVLTLQTVRIDFDARFSATGKEYRYFIWNDAQLLPDVRRFRYHVRIPLDVRAMRRRRAVAGRAPRFCGILCQSRLRARGHGAATLCATGKRARAGNHHHGQRRGVPLQDGAQSGRFPGAGRPGRTGRPPGRCAYPAYSNHANAPRAYPPPPAAAYFCGACLTANGRDKRASLWAPPFDASRRRIIGVPALTLRSLSFVSLVFQPIAVYQSCRPYRFNLHC